MSRPVIGFVHAAVMGGWWDFLKEMHLRLKWSGLYHKSDKIYVTIVGQKCSVDFIEKDRKYEVLWLEDMTSGEEPTISLLHEVCQESDESFVWYIHTKGVAYEGNASMEPMVKSWREYLQYFTIDRHEDCIRRLGKHKICGVDWYSKPKRHFAGNFWWAQSEYIAELETPATYGENRHSSEYWIGSGVEDDRDVGFLHHSLNDFYKTPYGEGSYKALGGGPKPFSFRIVQRAWNTDLVEMSSNLMSALSTTPLYKTSQMTYPMEMMSFDEDFIINVDEDCFIWDMDTVFELINYMNEEGIASAGMPDGGVVPLRHCNPLVHNMFFTIYNNRLIRDDDPMFPRTMRRSKGFKESYKRYMDSMPELKEKYEFIEAEQYYYISYYMMSRNYDLLHLMGRERNGCETYLKSPVSGKEFLVHTWYARLYDQGFNDETNRDEKERIDGIYQEAVEAKMSEDSAKTARPTGETGQQGQE